MAISFDFPDSRFWQQASAQELYMLDLQELFNHIFMANSATTIAFIKWLPSSSYASLPLCEAAMFNLQMMEAPLSYCNEDCDRRQAMWSWAMTNVPAIIWVDFRDAEAARKEHEKALSVV